ncbi:ESX secretion-associated protein EspG [Amycolatopsis sp. H20-H5]|uniref:ESX secretion-associated protein EspG n=1 Tax=Amycolatopsis sp. H20-H5 TaxID=3046309 RepID=UPI002DBBA1C9|nr:ESX secretion-associated protein EspG [Amycolatopsis sp. H20-H5]MEC3974672.1 ESX secretion-associated protein EspG [Amycolatopsis sp. H20-H5]
MLDQPLKFTTPTLLNLIRRRGGEPHQTLSGIPTWYDAEAQRILDQQVNAVLTEHGLMGPRGMDRDLISVVESISRPQLEYYGWFEGEFENRPKNFTVLAGSGSGGGFVLMRYINEDEVVVKHVRPELLLQSFVDQIPLGRPGNGQPIVLSKSEFTSGRPADDEGEVSIMRAAPGRGTPPSPIKEAQRILKAPRTGAGSLYVASRTEAGTRRRSERPLNFIDTDEGRWLMEERPGRGDSLVVFTPATPQMLGERLRNAQSTLS